MPKFTEWPRHLQVPDVGDRWSGFRYWLDDKLVPANSVRHPENDETPVLLPAIAQDILIWGTMVVVTQIILLHLIKQPALALLEAWGGASSSWMVDGLAWLLALPLIYFPVNALLNGRAKREPPNPTATDPSAIDESLRHADIRPGILPPLDIKGLHRVFLLGILLIVGTMLIYGVKGQGIVPYVWCSALVVVGVLSYGMRQLHSSSEQRNISEDRSTRTRRVRKDQ